jgi:putative sugar O-methyltransferase
LLKSSNFKNLLFRKLSKFVIFNSQFRKTKTSISDDNVFPKFALKACENNQVFSNFRQSSELISILEHVSSKQGEQYLQYVLESKYFSIQEIKDFCNEIIGNPVKTDFELIGKASPTTLRYIKVLGDLEKYFGDLSNYIISEIGIGYGGQARLITSKFSPKKYNLIDLDEVLKLGKKFLESSTSYKSFNYTSGNNAENIYTDLLISNYAFSELTRSVQDDYFDKIVKHSKKGYVIYNKIHPEYFESYTIQEFVEKIPNAQIVDEIPLTHPDNKLVIWNN